MRPFLALAALLLAPLTALDAADAPAALMSEEVIVYGCTLRLESVWMITGHAAGVAAAMAAKVGSDVQKVDVSRLQNKLRAQNQVIDFIPGQPEKCEHLNGPPEF